MKKIKYILTLLCCAVLWSSFSSALNYSLTEIGSQDPNESTYMITWGNNLLANYQGFCVSLIPNNDRFHWSVFAMQMSYGFAYSVYVNGSKIDELLNYQNTQYWTVWACYDKYLLDSLTVSEIKVERVWSVSWNNFYNWKIFWYTINFVPDCSNDSNYLTCLESLNVANWQVSTLSGSLSSCQSSLSTCQNNQDAWYLQCTESLSGCQSDLSSMTNYADWLNSQLQECLSELPSDEECEWTGCEELLRYDWLFSLFRMNDDQMFSLPVANNIMLPQGYKAYVDSWSVVIWEINKTDISMSDEEFDKVNSLYLTYFVWIWTFIFVCLFMYYIKKFIFKWFSILYKKK